MSDEATVPEDTGQADRGQVEEEYFLAWDELVVGIAEDRAELEP